MQAETEKLIRDVKVLIHDAEDLIKATAGDLTETTRETRARLAGAVLVTKDACHRVEEQLTDRVKSAENCLRANIYPIMGIAAAVGLAAGALLRREC